MGAITKKNYHTTQEKYTVRQTQTDPPVSRTVPLFIHVPSVPSLNGGGGGEGGGDEGEGGRGGGEKFALLSNTGR